MIVLKNVRTRLKSALETLSGGEPSYEDLELVEEDLNVALEHIQDMLADADVEEED